MREIKFRAWDAKNKEMINPYCELKADNHFWAEDLTNTHYYTPVAVMQFTGLKDKNGVEIYEGDICQSELGWKFVVEWDNQNARCLGFRITDKGVMYPGREPAATIIGNIYENPELLK